MCVSYKENVCINFVEKKLELNAQVTLVSSFKEMQHAGRKNNF